jgi:hypothetical protein
MLEIMADADSIIWRHLAVRCQCNVILPIFSSRVVVTRISGALPSP